MEPVADATMASSHPILQESDLTQGVRSVGTCSAEGCRVEARTNGMCKNHAEKARRSALPFVVCSETDCEKDRRYGTGGRCAMHAKRFRVYGDASITVRRAAGTKGTTPCRAASCDSLESPKWTPYCSLHGSRLRRHGDTETILQPRRVIYPTQSPGLACITWPGALSKQGYGPHRRLYEKFRGPVGRGMELDHLCRHHSCVNLDHLEIVTRVENTRRRTVAHGIIVERGEQSTDFWINLWADEGR